jgi:peptidoglycan/xylan/chitin deacetylase (PgdA/CDA1 family)
MSPLQWSVDPRDWTRPGTAAIVRDVLRQLRPGSVVLLHDGGGDRGQTLLALRPLFRALAPRQFVPALPQP